MGYFPSLDPRCLIQKTGSGIPAQLPPSRGHWEDLGVPEGALESLEGSEKHEAWKMYLAWRGKGHALWGA